MRLLSKKQKNSLTQKDNPGWSPYVKKNYREIKYIYHEFNYKSKGIAIVLSKNLGFRPLVRKLQQRFDNK